MAGRPTVYDVASHAGVSIATVSRYFSDPDRVSPATRDKVSAAVAELGYVQNAAAKGLAGGSNGTIALWLPDFDEPDGLGAIGPSDGSVATVRDDGGALGGNNGLYYSEIIRGTEIEARSRNEAVTIVFGRADAPGSPVGLSRLAGRVDGMIAVAGSLSAEQVEVVSAQMPIVIIADMGSEPRVDHIRSDNRAGMLALVRHLIETHGARRMVFLGGPAISPDSGTRFGGYKQALANAGLPVPSTPDLVGDFTRDGGRALGRELLASGRMSGQDVPDAVVCANDETALGVMDVFAGAGIQVPLDVAVTGFDGTDLARFARPPLTTVEQLMANLGRAAVLRLLARIKDPDSMPEKLTLPVRLVLRRSCGC